MANGVFEAVLPQSAGYGIILGGGFGFAVFMLILSFLQSKFTETSPFETEEFSSASRSVKPGLICTGIVSAWTWSATLMVSSLVVYQFGVSGGWWYAVCGTVEIIFFSVIAAKVKENANGARTFLEIVKARFGKSVHLMFMFYALFTASMVSAILLLGGSASISALTGMDVRAAAMLLPVGVIAFVVVGGLRSTFVSDFVHTTIVFVVIWIFVYTACGTSSLVGSPSKLYELLQAAATIDPVAGNAGGSYLTMRSIDGCIYAAISITLGSSTVFLDQSYWQRAIASDPKGTTRAYFLGGLSWFSVPLLFGSIMGLSARALQNNPVFPTYPEPLSASQQGAGLVAPAAAVALMGRSGAIAMLIVTYMAVTSAASAQLISVSSIFTYDVYRTYFRPHATARDMLRVAHIGVVIWGLWISIWSLILNAGGVNMNFVYYFTGTIIGAPVIPVMLSVLWPKLTIYGVLIGSLGGTSLAIMAWLITCKFFYGALNTTTLQANYSSLAGSTVSMFGGGLLSVVISLVNPDNYDFKSTRAIKIITEHKHEGEIIRKRVVAVKGEALASPILSTTEKSNEAYRTSNLNVDTYVETLSLESEPETTKPANVTAAFWWSTFIILCIAVFVPIPLVASNYIFSVKFFTGWLAIAMIWSFLAGFSCILLPIFESRSALYKMLVGLIRLIAGATIANKRVQKAEAA